MVTLASHSYQNSIVYSASGTAEGLNGEKNMNTNYLQSFSHDGEAHRSSVFNPNHNISKYCNCETQNEDATELSLSNHNLDESIRSVSNHGCSSNKNYVEVSPTSTILPCIATSDLLFEPSSPSTSETVITELTFELPGRDAVTTTKVSCVPRNGTVPKSKAHFFSNNHNFDDCYGCIDEEDSNCEFAETVYVGNEKRRRPRRRQGKRQGRRQEQQEESQILPFLDLLGDQIEEEDRDESDVQEDGVGFVISTKNDTQSKTNRTKTKKWDSRRLGPLVHFRVDEYDTILVDVYSYDRNPETCKYDVHTSQSEQDENRADVTEIVGDLRTADQLHASIEVSCLHQIVEDSHSFTQVSDAEWEIHVQHPGLRSALKLWSNGLGRGLELYMTPIISSTSAQTIANVLRYQSKLRRMGAHENDPYMMEYLLSKESIRNSVGANRLARLLAIGDEAVISNC